jgi:ribosomal-protein-alanine N-acetyltransferase
MSNVTLRPVIRSDAAELIEANMASREYHAPWVQPCTDMEGFETWFGQSLTGPNRSLIARHVATGEIVGVVNFSQIVWGVFRSAYVSYYGMIGSSRRGFMTEALGLAVAYGFDALGLHRLEANIQPGNLASLALVQRAGFRKEGFSPRYLRIGGVWCDHERWALLADDL